MTREQRHEFAEVLLFGDLGEVQKLINKTNIHDIAEGLFYSFEMACESNSYIEMDILDYLGLTISAYLNVESFQKILQEINAFRFYAAVNNGNFNGIKEFVEKVDRKVVLEGVRRSCAFGKIKTLEYLLEITKEYLNIEDDLSLFEEIKNARFYEAIKNGDLDKVKELIETVKGETIKEGLCRSGRVQNISVLDYLIEQESIDNECREELLVQAIRDSQVMMINHLMYEKNVNFIINKFSHTAFHNAAYFGKIKIVKYFFEERNVDINLTSSKGETALHEVCKYSFESTKLGDKEMALYPWRFFGYSEVLKYLLEKGIDASIKSRDGLTALMIAVTQRNLPAVKCLFENTQVDQENLNQAFLLAFNCFKKNPKHSICWELVCYLLEKGPDANAKVMDGYTYYESINMLINSNDNHLQLSCQARKDMQFLLSRLVPTPPADSIPSVDSWKASMFGHTNIGQDKFDPNPSATVAKILGNG